jgi:signal transduction histidine kinase
VQLPSWPLSSEIRHNLFLAFKETLNNTIRHASASEARITLQPEQGGFLLTVTDDGQGFDPSAKATRNRPGGGNGLRNMHQRLAQIGGSCEIQSAPGAGTTVRFRVDVSARR